MLSFIGRTSFCTILEEQSRQKQSSPVSSLRDAQDIAFGRKTLERPIRGVSRLQEADMARHGRDVNRKVAEFAGRGQAQLPDPVIGPETQRTQPW